MGPVPLPETWTISPKSLFTNDRKFAELNIELRNPHDSGLEMFDYIFINMKENKI